jgi:hypothetical protein
MTRSSESRVALVISADILAAGIARRCGPEERDVAYPLPSQLAKAVELIEERSGDRNPFNDVEIITVTIGGNDVYNQRSSQVAERSRT